MKLMIFICSSVSGRSVSEALKTVFFFPLVKDRETINRRLDGNIKMASINLLWENHSEFDLFQ